MDGISQIQDIIAQGELSQAQLAREAQCSQSHLSLVLARKRGMSIPLAKRLGAATGIAVHELRPDLAEFVDGAAQ